MHNKIFWWLLSVVVVTTAQGQSVSTPYFTIDQLADATLYLPLPPSEGSAQFEYDKSQYEWGKSIRETERGLLALQESQSGIETVFKAFSNAFGVEVKSKSTPALYRLLCRAANTAYPAVRKCKYYYRRQRPFDYFNEPVYSEEDLGTTSYPSWHSTIGWVIALIMNEINFERSIELLKKAYDFGQNRVIIGAHWQSDVDAGRIVASYCISMFHTNAVFMSDLEAAKNEYWRVCNFEYNGVWYNAVDSVAYVVPHPDTKIIVENGEKIIENGYSGNITIMNNFTYNNANITVRGFADSDMPIFSDSKITSVFIPNSISVIPSKAFANDRLLEKVVFEDKGTELLSVGDSVFVSCSKLRDVQLPSHLNQLGDHVFENCESLATLVIPKQCGMIGSSLLRGCTNFSNLVLSQLEPPVVRNGTYQDLAEPEIINNLHVFTSTTAFNKYETSNCWKLIFPNKFYIYAKPQEDCLFGTFSMNSSNACYLNKTQGFRAFRTLEYNDGKLIVEPIEYAYNDMNPMGDGVFFKASNYNCYYLLSKKVELSSHPATQDNFMRPSEGGIIKPSQLPNGVLYTLDARNGKWVKVSDDGVSLNYTEAFINLPGNASSMPNELQMILPDGHTPFGVDGDINDDGILDVEDVNALVDIILNLSSTSDYYGNADVTRDGIVDVNDVNVLINIMLGLNNANYR